MVYTGMKYREYIHAPEHMSLRAHSSDVQMIFQEWKLKLDVHKNNLILQFDILISWNLFVKNEDKKI